MEIFSRFGAMYAKMEPGDVIRREPIRLGDGEVHPGDFFSRLGDGRRAFFEMEDGYYLRFVGWVEETGEITGRPIKYLLFNVNDRQEEDILYCFSYAYYDTLFVSSGRARGYDVRIRRLQKVQNPKFAAEQLSLF